MSPALIASIRAALDKPLLSEEACRRVAVAVLEGVLEPGEAALAAGAASTYGDPNECYPGDVAQTFRAAIDALIREIER